MLTLALALTAASLLETHQPPTSTADQPAYSAAADYSASHSGRAILILKNGHTVFERYDNTWAAHKPHPLASGTKSFTGIAAMFAVQDGLLTLDELAADTLTEWKDDPQKSRITIRHLLTLSSGLDPSDAALGGRGGGRLLGEGAKRRAERLDKQAQPDARDHYAGAIEAKMVSDPGQKFMYGSSHFYAFGALLERKLAAAKSPHPTILDYMHAKFLDPIGLHVAWFGKDPAGRPNLPGGCLLTAREWAKFGEFVRLEGSWKDEGGDLKPLLKPDLLAECFKPAPTNPSYGLTWWLGREAESAVADNDGAPTAPSRAAEATLRDRLGARLQRQETATPTMPDGKPIRVYMAAGLGKQRLYILPDQHLVIVRFAEATREGNRFSNAEFLKRVLGLPTD